MISLHHLKSDPEFIENVDNYTSRIGQYIRRYKKDQINNDLHALSPELTRIINNDKNLNKLLGSELTLNSTLIKNIMSKYNKHKPTQKAELKKLLLKIFDYSNLRNRPYFVEFFHKIPLDVCPYCLSNYVRSYVIKRRIKKTDEEKEVTTLNFQLDHFLPKDKFPFLALNFYNLIPSCPSCNHKKSNKLPPLDNIYSSTSISDKISWHFDELSLAERYIDENANLRVFLNIDNCTKPEKSYLKLIHLEEIGAFHSHLYHELFDKFNFYRRDTMNSLVTLLEKELDSYNEKWELTNLLYSVSKNNNINNSRPMSKLINDLYTDLVLKE